MKLVDRGFGKIAVGFGGNPKDSSAVRGGPAFEVLFNIHNMLKKRGLRDKFELTFFWHLCWAKTLGSKQGLGAQRGSCGYWIGIKGMGLEYWTNYSI